jgi:hypothetical protein
LAASRDCSAARTHQPIAALRLHGICALVALLCWLKHACATCLCASSAFVTACSSYCSIGMLGVVASGDEPATNYGNVEGEKPTRAMTGSIV